MKEIFVFPDAFETLQTLYSPANLFSPLRSPYNVRSLPASVLKIAYLLEAVSTIFTELPG
jgi:hypothetical protein